MQIISATIISRLPYRVESATCSETGKEAVYSDKTTSVSSISERFIPRPMFNTCWKLRTCPCRVKITTRSATRRATVYSATSPTATRKGPTYTSYTNGIATNSNTGETTVHSASTTKATTTPANLNHPHLAIARFKEPAAQLQEMLYYIQKQTESLINRELPPVGAEIEFRDERLRISKPEFPQQSYPKPIIQW